MNGEDYLSSVIDVEQCVDDDLEGDEDDDDLLGGGTSPLIADLLRGSGGLCWG